MADDTLTLNPNGTVSIRFDGYDSTWRRPTLREFRSWREQLVGASKAEDQEAAIVQAVRDIASTLGNPLPDDSDDWPIWTIADATWIPAVLAHWRAVPLVRG